MNVEAVNFRGMINIVGNDTNVLVNRDSIESITNEKYLDTKRDTDDESLLGMKIKQGTYLNLTSGNKIKVYAPLEDVLDVYKRSKDTDVELNTKYNPLQIDKWL